MKKKDLKKHPYAIKRTDNDTGMIQYFISNTVGNVSSDESDFNEFIVRHKLINLHTFQVEEINETDIFYTI